MSDGDLPTREPSTRQIAGYELTVISEYGVSRRALPERGALTIGRDPASDVRLEGPQVSRHHARLAIGEGFLIEDLRSANGTILRHGKLAPRTPTPLSPGDTIQIGDFALLISPYYAERPQPPSGVIVRSPAMVALYEELAQVARAPISVLILGETGVGKDVVARSLHAMSPRRDQPFLRLNCAALTPSLLESELFGHERGAFTGAATTKPGLLESANGGTVFLDEIGEFPLALQPKLLQVLETREVLRVGSVQQRAIDVRFVAATNRDLSAEVAAGRFRGDLFYRLAAVVLEVPPLRERAEDIPVLAAEFLRAAAGDLEPQPLDEHAIAQLSAYDWPGNARELRNVIERAHAVAGHDPIGAHLRLPAGASSPAHRNAPEVGSGSGLMADEAADRQRIIDVLVRCNGNQSSAARMLGISRSTLLHRLDAYRISRPRKRPPMPT